MADAYTDTTALANLVSGSVDQYVRAALRATPVFRNLADVRPVQVSKPGDSVTFYTYSDLEPQTTAINETTDPDFIALDDPSKVQVTLNEYGAVVCSVQRLRAFSFSSIEQAQMDQVAFNLRDTMDKLVSTELGNGTKVQYAGDATTTDTIDSTDTIASENIRVNTTKLRSASVQGRQGDLYLTVIHPDVSHDLRAKTGAGEWRDAHVYAAPGVLWPAVIGQYEGQVFIDSPRCPVAANANSVDVYSTFTLGREALIEAVAVEPHTVIGTVSDKLGRFYPMGWTGILGWGILREDALQRIESASSLNS